MERAEYLRLLGEQLEPGGRERAPEPLGLVQRFINTSNHELGGEWDRLGTPAKAASWLARNGLMARSHALSERDRLMLIRAREALREMTTANRGEPPRTSSIKALHRIAREAPLRLRFGRDEIRLESTQHGAHGAVGHLFALVYRSVIDGTWSRLKPCRQCGWLFYDDSKNRSGSWCSMSVCGNRAKNRAYRRRMTGNP